jgi:hypothetical protein
LLKLIQKATKYVKFHKSDYLIKIFHMDELFHP